MRIAIAIGLAVLIAGCGGPNLSLSAGADRYVTWPTIRATPMPAWGVRPVP